MRIRWKALPGLLGVIAAYLVSPAATNAVPAKYAWILALVSGLLSALLPALVTDRPSSSRKKKTTLGTVHTLPDSDRQ